MTYPRYWTDTDGTNVGEWVEVSAKEWCEVVDRARVAVVVESHATPDYLWTVWGYPGVTPIAAVYSSYAEGRFTDTRLLLVPLVEDWDAHVAGPHRGPDPLPDVPAPDFGDDFPY